MILVTGGAGLIGSACIEELNHRGETNIFVVDHLGRSDKWKNLSRMEYVDYQEKDDFLAELDKNPQSFQRFTHVLHLGACSATTEKDATYLIRNNYEYTKRLAHLAVQTKQKNGHSTPFVYASSAATYGEGEQGYDDRISIQKLRPLNMYGYSKHMFDLYATKSGLLQSVIGLKYFNVFGYGEAHKEDMRSLVLKGYEQIRDTGELKLFRSHRPDYRDGEQKRDFLYAKDAARISLHFLLSPPGVCKGLYNVGRGIAETWNDLAGALFSAMGKPVKIQYVDMPETLREKYQYYTCADTHRLREAGYNQNFTDLKAAIQEYVDRLEGRL